ncbi:DTW domain-containing protein [Pseudomonas sp. SWI6]|uniref:tRNA-uridine aminocarboxypropyltransferase n=1 Tax=Pseudomonas taiwanensis TaxID=470150 RepID=A0ABR6VBT0_9PSED|nr:MULTISPECIES: DTW domain-containing protein [Pseudomonas]AGZ36343.1 DTW domain-containing protein [Pseudomonas sp. VLB120]AVD82186.1 DTW domain-containing protein [Pseudomonas sp. SWI6]AVD89144.1 DTW domain-containing protein [Pseudomonas sp. SWI44]MBC3477917.1 DTW domain-containing protein [Pseudomonas taiwanensis]MBC3492507.1 DTW domain-containing protein [Pseudomonas taiwanensis]
MSRPRCERCLRPQDHCLCSLIPHLDSRTRVLVLQHASETTHALNTARFVALGLANAQLRVGEVFEDLADLLATPGYRPVILFPGDGAEALSAYGDAQDTPLLLIVPDGTWRKARKLLYLNPLLQALPRVTLGQVTPSRYRLRKAPEPGALSTIEAVVQALNALEAPECFDPLLQPFEALIEGQIAAMGRETFQRNHGQDQ